MRCEIALHENVRIFTLLKVTKVWHLCMLNPEAVCGGDRVEKSPVGAKADTSLNLIRSEIKEMTELKAVLDNERSQY